MTTNELLGKVAARYLKEHLSDEDATGTARYLLDCLTAEQTAAIAHAVLADGSLANSIDIRLPQTFLQDQGLPAEILTSQRTTYFRNAHCAKSAWLLANVGDDEQQSVTELIPIGAPQLLDHPEIWIAVASEGLPLTDDHKKWWQQALKGLIEARQISLERFSKYVADTRSANIDHGEPIRSALGYALPALHIPRDTNYFNALNDKVSGHVYKWKQLFAAALKKRACYLVKQNPSQGLLDEETLQSAFAKVRDSIPPQCHQQVEEFIAAPSGWNDQAASLAECEWEDVKPLFDGLRREKFNLGKATIEFYDERDPEELTDTDRDYLQRLIARKTTEADEEDEAFYRDHRLELKDQPSLKAKWDRFIYGAPIETEDFIGGVTQCLQALFDQDLQSTDRKLTIRSDKRVPRELKGLNREAGMFFAFRYRGFRELLGRAVTWDLGQLLNFHQLDETWRSAAKPYRNRSAAKAALQIKFFLELEVTLSNGTTETYTKQLLWKFNPNGVASELCHDWSRLAQKPLVRCQANRELVSGKGRVQSIDLRNVKTLLPTYDRDRGSLVAVYRKENDIRHSWPVALKNALAQQRISDDGAELLTGLFDSFTAAYTTAVEEFQSEGLVASSLTDQLKAYSELLAGVCLHAKGDRNRESLLRPLLELGAVPIEGGPLASIVPPWHPLRIGAMCNKALHVAGLIKHLVSAENVLFGDTKLYFEELEGELQHPYYPEILLAWRETQPELLSFSDHYLDYSLHEPPITQPELYADTNENPAGSALRIIGILKRYLSLHPHEQANLSVVLYNSDSARLPHAIVDRIQEIHEDEEDMRCQVILRHRDGNKLRDLYEQIIDGSASNADSFIASEATRDFMARLRIGIMADEAPPPDDADGPPQDVVYLQDVIARHAKLSWDYSENANPIPLEDWVPPRWSRRRPAAADDMKSVVYLCSPVASEEGWNFRTAISTFFKGDWDGSTETRILPARQLDFNDPLTAQIFKEVHNLGNWVVNYDELLDRRQLVNQQVKVIRYKQTDTQGRNMLISSNASTSLLHRMVQQRLRDLTLGISEEDLKVLAKRLIDEANLISGDLVLRAAKRGRNASELIGVVLSRYLIQWELGEGRSFGWYFLDDYADWLGQPEQQIADILALSPETDADGNKQLAVVISESKYIDHGSLSPKRKESQKQLRQTIDRIGKALFGDPGRLDRDIWLSRFSDMVLNGIQFPANSPLDLSQWRRAIREGDCTIYLRGYSHVFVSGPTDCPDCSDFVKVADCTGSFQEIFSRAKLRELLLHYWNATDPGETRRTNAGEDVWSALEYKRPSDRITTLVKAGKKPRSTDKGAQQEPATISNTSEPGSAPPTSSQTIPSAETSPSLETQSADSIPEGTGSIFAERVGEDSDTKEEKEWLKEVESKTKGALQQFQLRSKLVSSSLTPNAGLLKFQGSANLTVDQVLRKKSEFLTTHGLNLISVRAEPGLVAMAVARPNRRVLSLSEVWPRWNPDVSNGNQELLVGVKEDDGSLLVYSPRKHAPHALIAGSTGSGKSVLLQNVILSIAATNRPEQAQILIIDPKQVDFLPFSDLPHLKNGIIDEQENAISALNELVDEMNRRYALMKENRVNNIFDLVKKTNATEKPPVLWVIHDEFAEWMMIDEYKEAVSNIVSRLGVKARAAGIFLIFAAQRPDAGVMPMQLRANLGNRLILKVDGEGTSEIALGEKGADRLLGKGHLCAKLEGEPSLVYAQVPFISQEHLDKAIRKISARSPAIRDAEGLPS